MENVKKSLNGFRIDAELKNVPISFVNSLRRILLAEIPTVVLTNIEILDNTSSMTHEMIRHRVEQLPINVQPEETAVIRDTRIEVRFLPSPDPREITTDDFVVGGPRKNVMLYDRDLDEPILFLKLAANESLHIRATLGIAVTGVSQVCVSTFKNHIDPERVKVDRGLWIDNGGDPREYDNHHIQRSYAIDEDGRPYWFDLAVESIGSTRAADLIKTAVGLLQAKIVEFTKAPVLREEPNWYRIEMKGETFTLGQLVQEVIYKGGLTDFVSRDVGHPLDPVLTVRFNTKASPESVVERFKAEALALCENVLKSV